VPRPGRHRRTTLFALLTVAGLGAAGWLVARERSRTAERAAALEAARVRAPDAPVRLGALLARDPGDAPLLAALIDWQLGSNVPFGEIEPHLNRLCEAAPADTDPIFLRAKLRVQNGRAEDGLADARRVLELDPTDRAARKLIAITAAANGRYPAAVEQLTVLLDGSPADRELARMLTDAHLLAGDAASAGRVLEQYFPATDGSAVANLLRGRAHHLSGRTDAALAALRAAAAAPSHREEALFRVTDVLRGAGRDGDLARATDDLARAKAAARLVFDAAQQPDNLPAQLRGAEQLLADDRAQEAKSVLDRAVARHGKSPPLAKLLARACRAGGRPDLAAEWDRFADH